VPHPKASSLGTRLQAKILGFALLCVVVPVLVMGGYLLKRNQEILKDKVRETLSNHLFRKASQVDDWMNQRLREAARWSASFVVYEGVESLSRPGNDAIRTRRDLKDYLESVLGHYAVYESLFIVDLSGQVLAATRDEHLDGWGRELLAKGGPTAAGIVSPIHRSDAGRPTLIIVQPIQGRLNRTVGYFVERLDLRELESHLNTPVDAETVFSVLQLNVQDAESRLNDPASDFSPAFWLLDAEGRVQARAGTVVDGPGEEAFPGILLDKETIVGPVHEAPFPGIGPTVYGLRRLEGPTGGFLAATMPSTMAYRSLAESRNRLLKLALAALGFIGILNYLAARHLLRPIHLLSLGARKVSAGELDVYLPVHGSDEIAALTQAFNEMAQKIRMGRHSLEEAHDELARTNEGLKAANRTLEALAITDGLTGLYNHRHFQETLEKEIRRCERESRTLSLLLLDLDHFKQYNDRFGHTEGDAALRRVAGQIMKSTRSTDMAFRYGGEEMTVLLPSCTKDQACEVAEKIRVAVSRAGQRPGRFGARVTVSIGVATFPEDGRVARALVDMADTALYAAKAQGRDRVVLAGHALPSKSESAS
jgi:diguanylate cyclase (GGDEF)-like protein